MEFLSSDISAKSFLQSYKPKPVQVIKRGQYLSMFFYKLDKDWNGAERLTRLRVGIAMKHFPDWELPVIWKICEESTNFAKTFWWKVKVTPIPKKEKKPKNLTLKLH